MTVARPSLLHGMPFHDWPAHDRSAWNAAMVTGGILDDAGSAAHWSVAMRKSVQKAYGVWLAFVLPLNPELRHAPPADRVTISTVRAFLERLDQTGKSSRTRYTYLADIKAALHAVSPDRDHSFLLPMLRKLRARVVARTKPVRDISAAQLLGLGLRLMRQAIEAPSPAKRGRLYRNGLMIALLASRPLRIGNFVSLRIDKHLTRVDDGSYWIKLGAHETKNRRELEFRLPAALVPWIERYLREFRTQIPGAARHDALWPSDRRPEPLSIPGAYRIICAVTRSAFGQHVSPHWFRTIAATTVAMEEPDKVQLASDVLGHARFTTTEQHYMIASAHKASAEYLTVLNDMHARLNGQYASVPRRRRRLA